MSKDAPETDSPLTGPELPAIGLVADLAEDDRQILSSYGHFHLAEDGQVVIEQGQHQDSLYFLIHGSLHAKRVDNGRETLIGTIKPGEWFGEVNMFDPGAASATVIAVQRSQIWQVSREELQDFFQNYPLASLHLTIGIATVLSKRIRGMGQRLVDQKEYDEIKRSLLG